MKGVQCKKVWDDGLGGDKAYDVYEDGRVIGCVYSTGRGQWRASTGGYHTEGGQAVHTGWNYATTRADAIVDLRSIP